MNRFHRAIKILRFRGLSYLGYLITDYWVPRWLYSWFQRFPPPRKLRKWVQYSRYSQPYLQLLKTKPIPFTRWETWPLDIFVRQKVHGSMAARPGNEVILGQVDNDGRLFGEFGPLPGWVAISQSEFVPRRRFPLDVILRDGFVLIRKNFRGNRSRFLQEWHNLTRLADKANVPGVYYADEANTILYKNLIVGRTIRDVLVENGANILTVQTDQDPTLAALSPPERIHAVLARGRGQLAGCLPESFFCELEQQLDRIHREGIAGLSLTFGNVLVDREGKPWLIDFEGAEAYKSIQNPVFLWHRNQDRVKFNMIYGRTIWTEESAREELARVADFSDGWYAPIDFGNGLAVAGFWTVDSGTGRWDYLNRKVLQPYLQGNRILDLGSNNGLMPMMMLRDGAREVIGLELKPEMVERARVVHQIFEWRDMKHYPFSIHQVDMRVILDRDFGHLDLVTAFSSLYYLTEKDMARVVRRSAELSPMMVLQAKTDTRQEARNNKAEKSSIPYLKSLLEVNGFPRVELHAPAGYSRPLLVGHKN